MGKYLDFYKKCMKTGEIPFVCAELTDGGLCSIFGVDTMRIFEPYKCSIGYWASDLSLGDAIYFGPTRQNIVLFLAAMNGEFNRKKK